MRDPRQDPKPGDITESVLGSLLVVDEVEGRTVRFHKQEPTRIQATHRAFPLHVWRSLNIGAAIVNIQ